MTQPDFEQMSKEQVVAWFDSTDDLSPLLSSIGPATEPVTRSAATEGPMVLASIRLPVEMVEQLDSLADLDGSRRSEVIRQALGAYLAQRFAPVARDEAEHALDVLRRLVLRNTPPPTAA